MTELSRRSVGAVVAAALSVSLPWASAGQTTDGHELKEIFARMTQALGGDIVGDVEALELRQTVTFLSRSGEVFESEVTVWFQKPGRFRRRTATADDGIGFGVTREEGMVGNDVWMRLETGGNGLSNVRNDPAVVDVRRRSYIDDLARLAVALLAGDPVGLSLDMTLQPGAAGGGSEWSVGVRAPHGSVGTLQVDAVSYLPLRWVWEQLPNGAPPDADPVAMQLEFEDFREVDGLTLPHRFVLSSPGGSFYQETTVDQVVVNPDLPEGFFRGGG